MARTAVDLPDPLENASDAALIGADDLLAQLAGDEVDRLLSEADAEPIANPAAPPASPPAQAGPFPASTSAVPSATQLTNDVVLDANEAALDDLLNEIDDARLPADPEPDAAALQSPAEQVRTAEESMVRQADALIAHARQEGGEAEAAVVEQGLEVLPPGTPAPAPASAADALAAEMEADERAHAQALRRMKALADAPAPDAADPDPVAVAEVAAGDDAGTLIDESAVDYSTDPEVDFVEPRVPLLVRVLEWINSPLAGLSDAARQAVGKIALATSVNAIAVFTYVLIFRRH